MFIIDFEASSLAALSYPIEVAWCDLQGVRTYSTLINPDSAGGWDDWDSYAEIQIHGLTRERCCQEGANVLTVVQEVEELLLNHPVFSDAHWQDQTWLDRLFEAVGKRPPAKLMSLDQAVPPNKRFDLAVRLATPTRPHRALADCQLLAQIVREVRAGA